MTYLSANSLGLLVEDAIARRSSRLGRVVHAKIVRTLDSPPPPFLSNHLINMYSKLDLQDSARIVLRRTPARNVVSWTALVAGLVQNGHFSSALFDFCNMRREGISPNDFTLPCAFKASASLRLPVTGKQLHALSVKNGRILDVFVGCSAFDMYSKTGLRVDARKLFDEIPERNSATWNAFISNAVADGRSRDAIEAFIEFRRIGGDPNSITFCAFLNACSDRLSLELGMQLHGFILRSGFNTDVSVSNGLIDFYGKCEQICCAEMVFTEMGTKNAVSWCSLLAAHVQNHEDEKASVLFSRARNEGIEPTDFLISSALSACAGMAGLELGRSIHALAVKACIEGNIFVGSALVDMYGKCGSIEDAEWAFDEMPEKNLVTLNSLIGGYTHQGGIDSAIQIFDEIASGIYKLTPNYLTFVSILSACSRAGAVDKGMELFESMKSRYGIDPGAEHYACVVDMLGRAGMVESAYEFIQKMPFQPTISVWGALLNACRVYSKPQLGKVAAENLFKLDPKDSGHHVLLSNLYAATGRWAEANAVREEMKGVGIKKGAGYSWITVKNQVHAFQAKDTSHRMNHEIQARLAKLRMEMEAEGYKPDSKLSLYDLEEEEKAAEVAHHSEKLALAFGLVALPAGVPIRITKNLRICGDCHSFFKFASKSVGREIVVRDNNRFHRFRDGLCSCKDYW
ncbi:PREDICTED: pentatricopeptide repeat-containing protein At4g14850 [Tarenaya hassleriana]|uniref:pentatricopeptide repeat-containing protein At4g14850 n=1 Tax=Tarenaya hassleriana TaxID=28532 RepID=UPI00053C3EB2|nr:PREDICTED: pentatricopeptide repeat-containing protein At4g14850 [Tarenaya hassleriana]